MAVGDLASFLTVKELDWIGKFLVSSIIDLCRVYESDWLLAGRPNWSVVLQHVRQGVSLLVYDVLTSAGLGAPAQNMQ